MKRSLAEHQAHIARVDSQDAVVAYFDLDRTLIDGYSLTALAWQQLFSGAIAPRRLFKLSVMFLSYAAGIKNYAQMLQATVDDINGMPERELITLAERAYDEWLAGWIYREGCDLVAAHQALGHEVVMVTSATRYQAAPVAQTLGIKHLRCTELEIVDGKVTRNVTPCYGAGKAEAADGFAQQSGMPLKAAYFYSDSQEDLPLLELVGHPVVVNAKSKLRRIAQQRGWPQLRFVAKGLEDVTHTA